MAGDVQPRRDDQPRVQEACGALAQNQDWDGESLIGVDSGRYGGDQLPKMNNCTPGGL